MKEVPTFTLTDEALDLKKCRQAVEAALEQPEPKQAFNRHTWLANTKEHLKRHASASQ